MPAWAWLAGIVVASFAFRAWLARGMVAPFIMVDELDYSELAKSFAAGGHFLIRDRPATGFGVVYPVLLSPAYALFTRVPDAYTAVKIINAAVMSLAAVPAYFLCRRVVRPPLALLGALLAVALPSMVYTGAVMTENAFYPLFLVVALQLVLVLERPTLTRQLVLLALIGVAFETRVQAVALLPAVLVAPLLLALFERRDPRAVLRPLAPLYALVVGGAALVLGAEVLRGRSPSDLFGAYSIVGQKSYDVHQVADFLLWHLAELDLYLGVLPVAATVALVALARSRPRPVQAFLAAAVPLVLFFAVAVAAFASQFADRIQERNLFFVAPLFIVGLLVWVEERTPRPPLWLVVGAAALAALLPLTIPYGRFIQTAATSDTLALLPIWSSFGHLLFGGSIDGTVALFGAVLGILFIVATPRLALVLPLVTLAYFAVILKPIWYGSHGFKQASAGALFQGIRTGDRDWLDAAVSPGTTIGVLWTGRTDRFTVNENEFFNRSVGPVYYVGGPTPGGLPETEARFDRRGIVRLADGSELTSRYMLLEPDIDPDGRIVATDAGTGMTLWRLFGPLRTTVGVTGIYPGDTWSGRRVVYRKEPCRPGTLAVAVGSDPSLFHKPSTIVVRENGSVVTRFNLEPVSARVVFRVPLRPAGGVCRVVFDVSRTAVPSRVQPGNADTRRLGAHFYGFVRER